MWWWENAGRNRERNDSGLLGLVIGQVLDFVQSKTGWCCGTGMLLILMYYCTILFWPLSSSNNATRLISLCLIDDISQVCLEVSACTKSLLSGLWRVSPQLCRDGATHGIMPMVMGMQRATKRYIDCFCCLPFILLHWSKSSRSCPDSFIAIVNDRLQQPAM